MVVAVICDVLGKKNNGTTLALTNLIDYLRMKGHTVKVVCPDEDKKGMKDYYIVPTLHLGRLIDGIVEKNGVKLAKADKSILCDVIKSADVVHIGIPLHLGSVATKIAKKLGKPITASFHAQAENVTAHIGMMNFEPANYITYKVFYSKVYKHVDAVHYPTQFIREVFEKTTHKTNAYVISNGVNEEFFLPHEKVKLSDKFTIVCSGRLSKEKGQGVLLKAVAKSKHRDDIKIIFAGDGPRKRELTSLRDKLGVDAEFNFYSREDIITLLSSADLYVHSATVEIEAIACLEAIVSGLVPVICNSKKSATKNFALDDNNLFPAGNPNELAKKIDFWYENPLLKAEYQERYKTFALNFKHKDCMEKMESMLFDAIKIHNEKERNKA